MEKENPYQAEIDEQKSGLRESYTIARSINPAYSLEQFKKNLEIQLKALSVRVHSITRAGGHSSDETRIAYFAHKQLLEEIEKELAG